MPTQERSLRTRDKLLEAGLEFLIRQGYNGTGIKEVLDQVQVPKGSFYNYFDSKEDFVAQVIDLYASRVHAQLDEVLEGKGDALERLRKYFAAEIRRYGKQGVGCLLGNLGAEVGGSSEILRRAMARGMKGTRERFARVIGEAQEQGTVRGDRSAEELASVLVAAWQGSLIQMQIEGSTKHLEECRHLMLDDFLKP